MKYKTKAQKCNNLKFFSRSTQLQQTAVQKKFQLSSSRHRNSANLVTCIVIDDLYLLLGPLCIQNLRRLLCFVFTSHYCLLLYNFHLHLMCTCACFLFSLMLRNLGTTYWTRSPPTYPRARQRKNTY